MRVAKSKWKNVLAEQRKAAMKEDEKRRIRAFLNRMTEVERRSYEEGLAKQREEDKYNATHF